MHILNLNRTKTPRPASKQKPFVKAVRELAAKDAGGKVVIYEKTGLRSTYLSEIPILDAVEISADIEAAMLEAHGGGEYSLSVVNRDSEVLAKYSYAISGPPKGRKTPSEQQKSEAGRKRADTASDTLAVVIGKLADAAFAQGRTSEEQFTRTLQLAKELGGGDTDFQRELLSVLLNNSIASKDNQFDNVVRFLDVAQRLAPTMQPEDPLSAVLGAALPALVQGLLTKKGGGAEQIRPAQVHRIEDYLRQFEGKIDPGLLAEARQHLGQIESELTAAALPAETGGAVPVQPPSASQPQQREQAVEPAAPEEEEEPDLFDVLIYRFRQSVKAGAQARELAEEIVKLVRTMKIWRPDNPPWLVVGLIDEYDPAKLQEAIERFFGGIPELAANKTLQEQIKTELMQVLVELAGVDQSGIPGLVQEFLSKGRGEEAGGEKEDIADVENEAAPVQTPPEGAVGE